MSQRPSGGSTALLDPAVESAEPSFATVTELPGSGATREQLAMAYARYGLARQLAAGKDVLEVACGSGMGLGYLARKARRVVGGDLDPSLIEIARRHYGDRIEVRQLDAAALPFPDGSFDVVLLLEAIYYLPRPEAFAAEARRVLREGGALVICSANREWPGFNPSPFSRRYFSLRELGALLQEAGFQPELLQGFPVQRAGIKSQLLGLVRRMAVRFHLIPKTMDGKEGLKRLFYGKLEPFPAELPERDAEPPPLVPYAGEGPVTEYKVLYAAGQLGGK
jgi:SAM-dependent methyltransferase